MACLQSRRLARTQELLSQCEVVSDELVASAGRLKEFMVAFSGHFGRLEMREHGEDFVRGLLSDVKRKSVEPIAEHVGKDRRGLQRFIGQGGWDHRPVMTQLCQQVGSEIGARDGALVLDPTTFLKQGENSVGVNRQYSGQTGGIENCQVGVFLGYVSALGRTLVDTRLYLPVDWVKDRKRLKECRVPKGIRYHTACELGMEMLLERGKLLPHAWVLGDDEFGRNADFRVDLHQAKERYALDVPGRTAVCDAQQAKVEKYESHLSWVQARHWKDTIAAEQWARVVVRDGSKGPVVYYAIRRRVRARWRRRLSPVEEWLLIIRTDAMVPEYRYCLSDAEESIGIEELVRAVSARYWIEDCFERAKGEVGLSDYETRSWDGWHHHVTLSMLALWFLVREQRRLKGSTPAMTLQQARAAIGQLLSSPELDAAALAERITRRLKRNEQSRIDHWKGTRELPPLHLVDG